MAVTNGIPDTDGELTHYTPSAEITNRLIELRVSRRQNTCTINRRSGSPTYGRLYCPDRREDDQLIRNEQVRDKMLAATGIGRREILWVNGMDNTAVEHANAGRMLASVVCHQVTGIHNATGGSSRNVSLPTELAAAFGIPDPVIDLIQCLRDYLIPVGRLTRQSSAILSVLYGEDSEAAKLNMAQTMLVSNLATKTLLYRLFELVRGGYTPYIICHSQGNLITSNALWLLRWIRHPTADTVFVYGLASPAPSWPEWHGLDINLYNNANDLVTWLSGYGYARELPPVSTRNRGPSMSDGILHPHGAVHDTGYMTWAKLKKDILYDLRL